MPNSWASLETGPVADTEHGTGTPSTEREAIFLANDERTPGSSHGKAGDNTSVRIVRLPVLSDQVVKRWRVVKGPAEGQMVWVSTKGI